MTAEDVVTRYCVMHGLVGATVFGHAYAADCFCGRGGLPENWDFRTDEIVVEFVERALGSAIARETGKPKREIRAALAERRENVVSS